MVKWLKSPNSPNIEVVELSAEVLGSIEEKLKPRTVVIDLRRTPIVVISKTANIS